MEAEFEVTQNESSVAGIRERILSHRVGYRRVVFLLIMALYGIEMVIGAEHFNQYLTAPWYFIVSLPFAVLMTARVITYYGVFDPIRTLFVTPEPDSCGAGESYKAREGLVRPLGLLIACPICVGTHVASAFLLLYLVWPNFAIFSSIALALAGISALMNYGTEMVRWAGRAAQVYSGHVSPDKKEGK